MILESRHPAQQALVLEMGHAPLQGFFHLRTAGMYNFAQVFQDRLGKRSRLVDVRVNAAVFFRHSA